MTRTLYSVNGLATELQRDRRTVADAMSLFPADGEAHGRPAWFMSTAWKAFSSKSGELNGEAERARKDKELADRTALQNAVTRGELVSANDAEATWVAIIGIARERLLAMPNKLGARLAPVNSAFEVQSVIEVEVHAALAELAGAEVRAVDPQSPVSDDDEGEEGQ